MTIRVLVADDQAMVRAGFRMLLAREDDIEVVAEAGNGREAIELALRHRPTLVLMDIRMPEVDGLHASRRILDDNPAARILILTTFDLDEYIYEALQGGASGFVLKDADPEFLLAAIRTVHSGTAVIAAAQTRELFQHFDPRAAVGEAPGFDGLTTREREIFSLAAQGLSNAEIAKKEFLSEATVKTHISRVLAKLGLRDRVQLVVYAYENGLVD